MSITKKYLKSKPIVKVTFEVGAQVCQSAKKIVLLSDYNDWQPVELKKLKNGNFKVTENIPTNERESFQFIYRAQIEDGHELIILPADADSYVDNGVGDGGRNAVVVIGL